jgi:SAM-dependent methyltransferase
MKTRPPAPGPLPHSDACERNKGPILEVLRGEFAGVTQVLEIGSGTGQHAVHFAAGLPWLTWQPTELAESLPGLRRRISVEGAKNLRAPLELDVTAHSWKAGSFDGVFSANTLHIMHWPQVEALFASLPAVLKPRAVLAIYGPFRYRGKYTSASNASFDDWLHAQDPASGIRDFEAVDALARQSGFALVADHRMPANNQTLVWKATASAAGR